MHHICRNLPFESIRYNCHIAVIQLKRLYERYIYSYLRSDFRFTLGAGVVVLAIAAAFDDFREVVAGGSCKYFFDNINSWIITL